VGQSIEQLVTSTRYFMDLHAVPNLSPEECAELLARYKAEVADLAIQQEAAFAAFKQPAPQMPSLATMRALNRVVRKHRAACLAFARIEQAITQETKRAQRIDGLMLNSDVQQTGRQKVRTS
jgi:hypothetical protein